MRKPPFLAHAMCSSTVSGDMSYVQYIDAFRSGLRLLLTPRGRSRSSSSSSTADRNRSPPAPATSAALPPRSLMSALRSAFSSLNPKRSSRSISEYGSAPTTATAARSSQTTFNHSPKRARLRTGSCSNLNDTTGGTSSFMPL